MRVPARTLLAILAAITCTAAPLLPARSASTVVLTFDDLPEHGPLPAGIDAAEVARSITATLRDRKVPIAYGFANMAQIGRDVGTDPARAKALEIWTAAGYPLANHGWSHTGLDSLSAAAFERELMQNEAAIGAAPRSFRYPFLAEGKDPALRDAARRILANRGYSIAPVSIDFADWAFNTAYARCVALKDTAGVARLEAAFLADANQAIVHAQHAATHMFGRSIPHVLLLHAGAFTARMLPRLLDTLEAQGLRHGSLDGALADPVYAAARDPALPFISSTLSARPGYPPPPAPTALAEICVASPATP